MYQAIEHRRPILRRSTDNKQHSQRETLSLRSRTLSSLPLSSLLAVERMTDTGADDPSENNRGSTHADTTRPSSTRHP